MASRNVGYARVSTTDQDSDPQVDRLRAAGCDPIFRDDGVSGALSSRPDWDRCLKELRAGDTLVATKLDRFGRSMSHLAALFESLESRQVAVKCLDQPIDTTSAVGKLLIGILSAFAEFERNLTRERIVDKNRYNAHVGKVARGRALNREEDDGPDRRAFGFEDDNVAVREEESRIIQECAGRLLAGEPQAAIIADLNARQVRTMRGAEWGYTTFRQIMVRAKNAGYHTYRGEIVPGVRLPGEPILDETTWRRIVALYESRRPGGQPSGKYLLTGFAFCHCGARLKGRPVTGTNRRQYWCPDKHPNRTFVGCEPLETWLADWAIRVLRETDFESGERELEERRTALIDESAEIEATLITLAGRLGRQEISLARHDAAANPLDGRLTEIREQLTEIDSAPTIPAGRIPQRWQNHGYWLAAWDEGSMPERRAMIVRALGGRRIVVGPGKPARFDQERITITG